MKIDNTEPRIPLDRLKYPLEPKISQSEQSAEDEIKKKDEAESCDAFEREIIKRGARKFQEWLDELDIR